MDFASLLDLLNKYGFPLIISGAVLYYGWKISNEVFRLVQRKLRADQRPQSGEHAAIGKKIRVGSTDDWREIVGVAEDVHTDGVDKPALPTVYWPSLLTNFEGNKETVRRGIAFIVRSPRAGSQAFMH